MIPPELRPAFEEGHRVETPGGVGRTRRRRLANLVLPSGHVTIGCPGVYADQAPCHIPLSVLPGNYPVFITLAVHNGGRATTAFVTVHFAPAEAVMWEVAGSFFTDHGDGVIYDASLAEFLRQKKEAMSLEQWQALKASALQDGDGNLILDETTGANAIVFRACDWIYRCHVGRDGDGRASCLLIDGRVHRSHTDGIAAWFRRLCRR